METLNVPSFIAPSWLIVSLLGVVIYFLKMLHTDFRKLQEHFDSLDKRLVKLETKFDAT